MKAGRKHASSLQLLPFAFLLFTSFGVISRQHPKQFSSRRRTDLPVAPRGGAQL
jgi:hypothetical protein